MIILVMGQEKPEKKKAWTNLEGETTTHHTPRRQVSPLQAARLIPDLDLERRTLTCPVHLLVTVVYETIG